MAGRKSSLVFASLVLVTALSCLLGQEAPNATPPVAKGLIEGPLKSLVHDRSSAALAPSGFVNPKVMPGLVRWHPDFAAACDASRNTGKPVLLFQLLGRLDEQFC